MSDKIMKNVIAALITESKDFNTMLETIEKLNEFSNPDWIEYGARNFYQRFCDANKSIKDFVENNIERITSIKPLVKVYTKEISVRVIHGFESQLNNKMYYDILMRCPEILIDIEFLKELASI